MPASLHDGIGNGFVTLLYSYRGTRAPLGSIREVEVLQLGKCLDSSNFLPQRGRKFTLLVYGLQNSLATFIKIPEAHQHVSDSGNLHLIETPGSFLTIAGYKRYGSSLVEELDGLLNLTLAKVEGLGNNGGMGQEQKDLE